MRIVNKFLDCCFHANGNLGMQKKILDVLDQVSSKIGHKYLKQFLLEYIYLSALILEKIC